MATKKAAPKAAAKAPKTAPAAPAKPVVDEAAQLKELDELMERVKKAQAIYSTYTQEQVDKIFRERRCRAPWPSVPCGGRRSGPSGLRAARGASARAS